MPLEPSPRDHKDVFYHKKRARFEPVGRWRDSSSLSYYHRGYSRNFTRSRYPDLDRAAGHRKHDARRMYFGGSCQGYGCTGFGGEMLKGERTPSFNSSGDGKYGWGGGTNRGNNGYYRQRDAKSDFWEKTTCSPRIPRSLHVNDDGRTVNNVEIYASDAHSDFVSTNAQHDMDQHDSNGIYVNGLGALRRCEKENSMGPTDRKPFKWSKFRGFRGKNSFEGKANWKPKICPLQYPSGDVAACLKSSASCDEIPFSKKPRLGWGEGLATYEHKTFQCPDGIVTRVGDTVYADNTKLNHSLNSSSAEKNPGIFGFPDSMPSGKPLSVACSSSPVSVEKTLGKEAGFNDETRRSCVCCLCVGSQDHPGALPSDWATFDIGSVANWGSSRIGLLHSDDSTSLNSGFVQRTASDKVLEWKSEILEALEKTESEMDLLENQLKSFSSDSRIGSQCPAESRTLSPQYKSDTSRIPSTGPAHLQIDPCESKGDIQVKEINSHATTSSEFLEPTALLKAVSSSDVLRQHGHAEGLIDNICTTSERGCVSSYSDDGSVGVPKYTDEEMLTSTESNGKVMGCGIVDANGEMVSYHALLEKNKELAYKASKVFSTPLSKDCSDVETTGLGNVSCLHSDSRIKGKLEKRKRYLRFKERVLTFKHEAYLHLWKEDVRSLSLRKSCPKLQKEMSCGHQEHHSSVHSHLFSPVGNRSLGSTMDIINSSKFSSEFRVKIWRDALKMPALILDEKKKLVSRFVSSNGLIEDPCFSEKERAIINPWTSQEKEVFMDKLGTCGKDFRKIASFLDHKTTADCVQFYYKNHKSDGFRRQKKSDLSKNGKSSINSYLTTFGRKWNHKINAASLEMLGKSSAVDQSAFSKQSPSSIILGRSSSKISETDEVVKERSCRYDYIGNDTETDAADVLASIGSSLSSEALDSCCTSSVDPDSNCFKWKCDKVDSLLSDVTENIYDDASSDESFREMNLSNWTDGEKSLFIQAISSYGKDFAMISKCVKTRSTDQCKVFFSKARKSLGLDFTHPRAITTGSLKTDDPNVVW